MSESWQPTLSEIALTFEKLSARMECQPDPTNRDPYIEQSLRDAIFHLELQIPGWEPPFDADGARAMQRAAHVTLSQYKEHQAMVQALRGLSFAPHDPGLYYILGSAYFQAGSVELALRIFCHTLWINPGHAAAHADLELLSAFLDDCDDDPAENVVTSLNPLRREELRPGYIVQHMGTGQCGVCIPSQNNPDELYPCTENMVRVQPLSGHKVSATKRRGEKKQPATMTAWLLQDIILIDS